MDRSRAITDTVKEGLGGFGRAALCAVVGWSVVLVLAGDRATWADEPTPRAHLRAWSDAALKKLAGPQGTSAFLGTLLGPDPADPTRTRLLGRPAWGLNGRKGTHVFLGQGPNKELRITGPLTLAAVVQVDAPPANKAAILSKWQLINGGRAYELGVGADLYIYFHVSASGKWDASAAEVMADRPIKPGVPYVLAGVFEPGRQLGVYINGVRADQSALGRPVPRAVFDTVTPALIGARPGGVGTSGLTGKISEVWVFDRALTPGQLEDLTRRTEVTSKVEPIPPMPQPPHDLEAVRDGVREWYRRLQAPDQPYGAYRLNPGIQPDLYASADVAWIRWMMDDLDALSDAERREWIGFIQAQQNPDGSYRHLTRHIATHAFCHATGALNMLKGRQKFAPRFLDKYRDVDGIDRWLNGIDWQHPWGASHDIWGAGVPLACTDSTPQPWRDALFAWLDAQVDPKTGMWRRGVQYDRPLEALGGAFHIWPIYAALGRDLPYPERIIDSVLAMQWANGSFDGGFGYGNMDAVWVLAYLTKRCSHRRSEVRRALERSLAGLMRAYAARHRRWLGDAHSTESRVAALAILSTVLPDQIRGRPWRNPWHRRELFVIKVAGQDPTK